MRGTPVESRIVAREGITPVSFPRSLPLSMGIYLAHISIMSSFTSLSFSPCNPPDWTTHVHPEGSRYFVKKTQLFTVVTEARVDEAEDLEYIEYYNSKITAFIVTNKVNLPPNTFLVLERRTSGNCGYYFVDHGNQCLFWLDSFDFTHLVDQVRIRHTASLVGLQMRSHYWYHNELFPHLYTLTEEDLDVIEDMLAHAIGDVATSNTSTINYDIETLKLMHSSVQQFRYKGKETRSRSPGAACFIFRMYSSLYSERFICLHGEKGARLESNQSIYGVWRRSWFLKILATVMAFGPSMHFRRLKAVTVDSIVSKHAWSKCRSKLLEEWRDVILYATVVLTANVSFLTIQSVDDEGVELGHRTHAQRASDFSIVMSMGTIIFGLFLLIQHRESMNMRFIANRSASRLGLETLAVLYSLPYAMLMWSMISFFVSFCILWYKSNDRTVMIIVSVTCGVVVLLLLWGISASFEKHPYWSFASFFSREKPKTPWKTPSVLDIAIDSPTVVKDEERIEEKVGRQKAPQRADSTASVETTASQLQGER
ncbi:hypothetical protein CC2G_013844 [Coprinopsis cinerea AmutBmut pab1-1]|nr:hypothetical protein CC2G_013844 [Coprinopsis cinerea AmutBmut pab1-1]